MRKEAMMSLFVGLVMISSILGFAVMHLNFTNAPANQGPAISNIVNRTLTTEERLFVLRTGRVLIRDLYPFNCTSCIEDNIAFESFANKFSNFVVLEMAAVPENETRIEMIGRDGKIIDLWNITITEDALLPMFCELVLAQPKECLLLEI